MGLRTKITLALLALALVPLAVATGVLMSNTKRRLEHSTKEYRLAAAEVVVTEVRGKMAAAHAELAKVGAALALRGASVQDRERVARSQMLGGDFVRGVVLYSPAGQSVLTIRASDSPLLVPPPASLSRDLRGVARTEGLARLGLKRSQRRQQVVRPLIIPLYRGQEKTLYGYLWTAIGLGSLNETVKRVSQRRFGRKADRVYLLNDAFRVVAHADPRRLWTSMRGQGIAAGITGGHLPRSVAVAAEYSRRGRELVGELVPVHEEGWGVVVEEPREEVFADVRATLQTALAVGLGFAVLAAVLGLVMGRRLTAPVLAVSRATRRVAAGDFEVRVPAESKDEVGQMARAFNTMAADLRAFSDRVVQETRIRTDLSRYLSAELVEQVVSEKEQLELGGRRQRVTVLFADVVAFTPLAERHPPEFVVSILNELFSFLTEIVFKHGGIVDKFIGDCVMAVFGAPRTHGDDPLRAVRAADEMMQWLEVGNAKWRKDLGRELQLGIGINSGEAVLGNVGSSKRMEYTVIGDAVNVASRLETLARPGQVLMSRETMEAVTEEFDCEALGAHSLTGRGEPVEVHALVI
jgi:class 3 adenylate cyclase